MNNENIKDMENNENMNLIEKEEHMKQLKQDAGIITVAFDFDRNRQVVNEKKKTVVTMEDAFLNIKYRGRYLDFFILDSPLFSGVGKAVCSDDDDFNESVGRMVSAARAENEIYDQAKKYLLKMRKDLTTLVNGIDALIELIDSYVDSNKNYIKSTRIENENAD